MLHKCWLRSPGVETQKEVSLQWRWTNLGWSLAVVTFSSRNTRENELFKQTNPTVVLSSVYKQKFRNNSDVPWCPVLTHTHTHTHTKRGGDTNSITISSNPCKRTKEKGLSPCVQEDRCSRQSWFFVVVIFTLGNENVGAVMSVPVTTVWWLTIWISVVWFPASVCV